ncbi:MAG: SLBB domain-containing protein [Candidatus Omnitrophica bacterium]|nr:SLBB domain-containing protein [Candidatus Omnitrophota bacterium]
MKIKLFLIILGMTGWIALCPSMGESSEREGGEENTSYIIGSSDEINITVLGYPELSTQTIVLPDGFISFPYLGRVKTAGENIQTLTEFLQKSLDPYIYNPQVTITLLETRSKRFSVLGEVKKPGLFPLGVKNMTIYEAIAKAEGFLPTAYPQEVRVLRTGGSGEQSIVNLDLDRSIASRRKDISLTVNPGDIIYVPGKLNNSSRISVLGEVRRPGVFPMEDMNITVYEAIAQAEGFLSTAYKKQVNILRVDEYGNKMALNVNLDNASMSLGDDARLKLWPGDIVYVPGQSDSKQVSVIGKVAAPGRYNFDPGMTVIDVLTAAGWITKEGVASSVMLARRKTGNAKFMRINARNILKKSDFSQDVPLEPGDIIYVPEKFISKISTFAGFFSSSIEPVASTYLRVYDATNPSAYLVDR